MNNFQKLVQGIRILFVAAVFCFFNEVSIAQTMDGNQLIINGKNYLFAGVVSICPLQPSGNQLASCVKMHKEVSFFSACTSFFEKEKQCIFGVLPIDSSKNYQITPAVIEKAFSIEKIVFSSSNKLIDSSDVTCLVKGSSENFVVALGIFENAPRRDGLTHSKVISKSWVIEKSLKFTEVLATDVNCFFPDRN